jgi:hypothetical protein
VKQKNTYPEYISMNPISYSKYFVKLSNSFCPPPKKNSVQTLRVYQGLSSECHLVLTILKILEQLLCPFCSVSSSSHYQSLLHNGNFNTFFLPANSGGGDSTHMCIMLIFLFLKLTHMETSKSHIQTLMETKFIIILTQITDKMQPFYCRASDRERIGVFYALKFVKKCLRRSPKSMKGSQIHLCLAHWK